MLPGGLARERARLSGQAPGSRPALRTVTLAVYLPSVLYGVGQGAILPVIALSARQLGASLATAGLVVALAGVGQIAGDLPAGQLAARYGERRAMLGATVVSVLALVGCALAPSVLVLGASVLLLGLTGAVWGLARQAYLTDAVPVGMRARALSTLGGTHRIGMFVGPFVGALAVDRWGIAAAYWVHVVTAAMACAALVLLPELERRPGAAGDQAPGLWSVVRTHLPVLRTLGLAVLLVGAARASRQVVVPLWAEQLGLSPAATSLVFGLSGAVDMLLFYPAGHVMDRYGRAFVAVPSMVVLGVAHLLLPLSAGARGLLLAAVLMGLGNGMGSGLVMTLGADASPLVGRPQFLGAWRLCADAGNAAGPLVVSAVAAATALAPAVLVMGGVSFAAALVLARWVPRFDPVDRGGLSAGVGRVARVTSTEAQAAADPRLSESGRPEAVELEFRSEMTVDLVRAAASDSDVLFAARVSTKGEGSLEDVDADASRSAGLINYLMRDRHGSPFEHNSMTFYVQAPIFVFREFMRHRIASYNEESGRYRELRPVFYVPAPDRKLRQEGKPGHYVFVDGTPEQHALVVEQTQDVCRTAYAAYRSMLDAGVTREVARIVLPLTLYSSMYVTMNARALMNFLSLRVQREDSTFPSYPQREIEMVAEQMEAAWARLMPLTHAAFERGGRVSP